MKVFFVVCAILVTLFDSLEYLTIPEEQTVDRFYKGTFIVIWSVTCAVAYYTIWGR